MPKNEPCDDEVVVATVCCLDHHCIGSTLLTNFYRTNTKFNKLNSKIIINNEISNELIYHTKHDSQLIPFPKLLYWGSRDGFEAEDFHSRCDNQGPTLTIIKSAEPFNQIFGGFTTASWKSTNEYIPDGSAFIFKIEENSSNQQQPLLRKFNIKQESKDFAIHGHKNYLANFGTGGDFSIFSDCDLHNKSYSNYGYAYELPSSSSNDDEYQPGSEKAGKYLAGSYYFKVLDIEVYKITTTQ